MFIVDTKIHFRRITMDIRSKGTIYRLSYNRESERIICECTGESYENWCKHKTVFMNWMDRKNLLRERVKDGWEMEMCKND